MTNLVKMYEGRNMTLYELSADQVKKLEADFIYHPSTADQIRRYELIREHAREYAELLMTFCPPSRELSLALTELENAVMWANAAIARHEGVQ